MFCPKCNMMMSPRSQAEKGVSEKIGLVMVAYGYDCNLCDLTVFEPKYYERSHLDEKVWRMLPGYPPEKLPPVEPN